MYIRDGPPRPEGVYAGSDAAADSIGKRTPSASGGWRSGVYRANMQSERERKRAANVLL